MVNPAILGVGAGSVDSSKWTRGELLAVRGALFTARYPLPWGPRPFQNSNILNIAEVFNYSNLSDRIKAFKAYTDRGYTHAPMGPWIPGFDQNYHGIYPQMVTTFDQHLDKLQELADHGIKAVNFVKPDDWSLNDLNTYILPYYRSPRARKLMRLVVPMGWEPGLGESNATYCQAFRMLKEALPEAYLAIHMVADFDAPGNNDDLTPGLPSYIGNAGCWQRLAQAGLDVYLAQVGGYYNDRSETPQPGFLASFANHCHDQHRRFYEGYAGWPTHNAKGDQIRFVMAEYASYADFNDDWSESYAMDLGDIAIANGADGYFDGGRINVPKLEA